MQRDRSKIKPLESESQGVGVGFPGYVVLFLTSVQKIHREHEKRFNNQTIPYLCKLNIYEKVKVYKGDIAEAAVTLSSCGRQHRQDEEVEIKNGQICRVRSNYGSIA